MNVFLEAAERLMATPDSVTPSTTTLLKEIGHDELRNMLKTGYACSDVGKRGATAVYNAIYTGKKIVFVMSRSIVIEICKNDKNLPRDKRSLGDNKNYPRVLAALQKILKIRTVVEGDRRRPMIMSVVCTELIAVMGLDYTTELRETQMKACMEFIEQIDANTGRKLQNQTKNQTDSIEGSN